MEALGDVLPQVVGDGQVAALDLDAHRPTSLLGKDGCAVNHLA